MKSVTDEQQDANNKGAYVCTFHNLWVISIYIHITRRPLLFRMYTVLETVPCKEIHLDELRGQSYEEIKETVFATTTKLSFLEQYS
jgi:hypothetical protein